ncbi:MAG: hypothetical protein H3C27_15550 [Opitutaceae bacterium]|nr:hypothetical protein [Opitutaceae bacterium]
MLTLFRASRPFRVLPMSLDLHVRRMFVAGEPGGIYDPSVLSSLFADSAGTTPATVDGPVGRVLDLSGRGSHLVQSVADSRPTLRLIDGRYSLQFDGVDDHLVSAAALNLTATSRLTVCAAIRALNLTSAGSAGIGMVVNHNGTGAAAWSIQVPDTTTGRINFSSSGTASSTRSAVISGLSAPRSMVLTGTADIAAPYSRLRLDGAAPASNTLSQNSGPYASAPLAVARQSDAAVRHFNGHLYGLIIRGVVSSDREITFAERWAAKRAGVAL